MLLPMTLPTAMSGLPSRVAPIDTISSGELVPKATTVRPMTTGLMPMLEASPEAPRTTSSPPTTSTAKPTTAATTSVIRASGSSHQYRLDASLSWHRRDAPHPSRLVAGWRVAFEGPPG